MAVEQAPDQAVVAVLESLQTDFKRILDTGGALTSRAIGEIPNPEIDIKEKFTALRRFYGELSQTPLIKKAV